MYVDVSIGVGCVVSWVQNVCGCQNRCGLCGCRMYVDVKVWVVWLQGCRMNVDVSIGAGCVVALVQSVCGCQHRCGLSPRPSGCAMCSVLICWI